MKRHHYFVTLIYHKGSRELFRCNFNNIQVRNQKMMTKTRAIKKVSGPKMIKRIPKQHLCNGEIYIENISYLGYFR